MKWKKVMATAMAAVMLMANLSACGSSDTGAKDTAADNSGVATTEQKADTVTDSASASSGEVQEITWMFRDDLNATEDLISIGYRDTVERLNKDYEGVYHVTPITTNFEEYYTKLNALVAAVETLDVFIVSPGPNLTTYVDPGVAADLTEYVKADGWLDTFNGGEGAFSQQTYDGKIYAVPLNIELHVYSIIQKCLKQQVSVNAY